MDVRVRLVRLSFCQDYRTTFDSLVCDLHLLDMEIFASDCYMVGAFTVFSLFGGKLMM